jgi:hypothetical protein
MSTLTYDIAASTRTAAPSAAPARKRKSLFARFIEARQKQAMVELARHGLRLPHELEQAGLRISARNEDSLPFVR